MMQISAEQRRRAFSVWMRTGRWPRPADCRELKFNPWHDPEDGRFTFARAGQYYAPGGTRREYARGHGVPEVRYEEDTRLPPISTREEVEAWRAEQLAKHGHKRGYREAIEVEYRRYLDMLAGLSDNRPSNAVEHGRSEDPSGPHREQDERSRGGVTSGSGNPSTPEISQRQNSRSSNDGGSSGGGGEFGGGGATGSWGDPPTPQTPPRREGHSWGGGGFTGGGGGGFGGAGASGSGDWPTSRPTPSTLPKPDDRPGGPASVTTARSVNAAREQWHTITRNGYAYELDARGRTRRVSGVLSLIETAERSRTNQRRAGGAERRVSDDGGHYIAGRFNGPTEAFNHFAQDKNFNRGRYRVIEDQWARAKQAGRAVTVAIAPHYREGSIRPFEINVRFTIDGREHSVKLPNERTEKPNGKR